MRLRALEASREAISASTRVRRNSSGFQRWVLAATNSSGASLRMAASRSRRKPATRSAERRWGLVLMDLLGRIGRERAAWPRSAAR